MIVVRVLGYVKRRSKYWFGGWMSHNRNNHHHSHHQVALKAQSSLILFHRPPLLSIASVRSFRLYLVSAQSTCWSADNGAFISRSPFENVTFEFVLSSPLEFRASSSSWIVCEMRGEWPYKCSFVCAASRICSKEHAAFKCSFHPAFSQCVFVRIHTVVLTQLGGNTVVFIRDQIFIWLATYQ